MTEKQPPASAPSAADEPWDAPDELVAFLATHGLRLTPALPASATTNASPDTTGQLALSVREVAETLGHRSEPYVLKLIHQGKLEATRDGRIYFVTPQALDDFMKSMPGGRDHLGLTDGSRPQ